MVQQKTNRASKIVTRFECALDQHYLDVKKGTVQHIFRVKEYAEDLGLHPNYLNNIIKTITGKSVGLWIAEKNIAVAKNLLKCSDYSIKEIAGRLHFTDAAHFSKYFKKHTALSPSFYRNQIVETGLCQKI